ncbi:hypothetical protein DICSQDRAFT_169253 [Dichomitus squalens LYAD-421 SS1]|uniref:Transmembrane protein 135 N-terminal domain-containing protein n=1 Tax=Dichomitus squalens (strain LYAD-421) TaxID=732165 RepID=R7T2X6_DICSQ|nr:uncharacterized protein DICSQDRAFT_169253 [Dichomitus squalens LYAD-421 SS1]EJF62222.1 hypothetical protein DICSQDRAFT_169253 [Dichomitus squalens LYAD-421 SS1]
MSRPPCRPLRISSLANASVTLALQLRKFLLEGDSEDDVGPKDLLACLRHAASGGLRASVLGFLGRSGISLGFMLLGLRKVPETYRLDAVRHALFGESSVRTAAMLGSFVAIYRLVMNLAQSSSVKPSSKAGINEIDEEPPDINAYEQWIIPAAAGGLAAAIGISFEKRTSRPGIAQEALARGLQGWYNVTSTKYGFNIPYGDILAYSLCMGQLMYVFLMRPEAIPNGLRKWFFESCGVPAEGVYINHDLVWNRTYDPKHMETIMRRKDITPENFTELAEHLASHDLPQSPAVPCAVMHPAMTSCLAYPPMFLWDRFKWMLPVYAAVHSATLLLMRPTLLVKYPVRTMLSATFAIGRTSIMQALNPTVYQALLCSKSNLYNALTVLRSSSGNSSLAVRLAKALPSSVVDALVSDKSFFVMGMVMGTPLIMEERRRRAMFLLYVLPRALESVWVLLRSAGRVPNTGRFGPTLAASVGMAMVMALDEFIAL